jgi:acyl-coenzyme A synthetase/AMP-(fatty) acid ligase
VYLRAADHLPARFNAAEWFIGRNVAEGRAESVAMIDGEGAMTYAALDDAVRRFASAIRIAGARRDERIALIVPDSQWLRAKAEESLAAYKCPKKITFVGELPKTATGKLKRYMLRDPGVLRGLAIPVE